MADIVLRTIGHCIYDPAHNNNGRTLGAEHIIPRGIGGDKTLALASCQTCEAITGKLEKFCIDHMFAAARPQFGIKGRRSRKVPDKLTYASFDASMRLSELRIPAVDHPGLLKMPAFENPPGILRDRHPLDVRPPRMDIFPVIADSKTHSWTRRVAAMGRSPLLEYAPPDTFGRMLIKIAYCRLIGALGYGAFAPLGLAMVFGQPAAAYTHLIGGQGAPLPPTQEMHEIDHREEALLDGRRFWVVRLRLFACVENSPTYEIVAGIPR